MTIGDSISRVKNTLKAVKTDPFITDRFVYSVIMKYAKMYIKREDNKNKLFRIGSIFTKLPCVELIEVDKVEACCIGISTGCIIKRTKHKLPDFMEGAFGPLFRSVASIDYSEEVYRTDPATYTSMTKTTTFKYNKNKYFWFINGYLYFPNLDWESVIVDGLFYGDTNPFMCDGDICMKRQDQKMPVPEYLFAEIEQMVLKELTTSNQIPSDGALDKQNTAR